MATTPQGRSSHSSFLTISGHEMVGVLRMLPAEDAASNKFHVELTSEEASLLSRIDFRRMHPSLDIARAASERNRAPLLALVRSLSDRQAVPSERLKYWNDPAYNPGRAWVSRKGLLERGGFRGEDLYAQPQFLPVLRYFLFGADLPQELIVMFERGVGLPAWVTSRDIASVGALARKLARRHKVKKAVAIEEFFKLCLDIGLDVGSASDVAQSMRRLR